MSLEQPQPGPPPPPNTAAPKAINYYNVLQVDPAATTTVIRYAYRYLAAMYHPDNSETADVEKFKLVTDAWRVLSDPNKRNAYDIQSNIAVSVKSSATLQSAMGRASTSATGTSTNAPGANLANTPSTTSSLVPPTPGANPQPDDPSNGRKGAEPRRSTAWKEIDLRLAVLQMLMDAKRKKPQSGGASAVLFMDCLGIDMAEMEYILWYLSEKHYIKREDAQFAITIAGVDYLVDQLSKTEIVDPRK
jgi:hypothetical protein